MERKEHRESSRLAAGHGYAGLSVLFEFYVVYIPYYCFQVSLEEQGQDFRAKPQRRKKQPDFPTVFSTSLPLCAFV